MLWQQSWIVVTETTWLAKSYIIYYLSGPVPDHVETCWPSQGLWVHGDPSQHRKGQSKRTKVKHILHFRYHSKRHIVRAAHCWRYLKTVGHQRQQQNPTLLHSWLNQLNTAQYWPDRKRGVLVSGCKYYLSQSLLFPPTQYWAFNKKLWDTQEIKRNL